MPSFEENPLTQEHEFLSQKISLCGSPQWRFHDPSLHQFDTNEGCDRQMNTVHEISTQENILYIFLWVNNSMTWLMS